MPSSFIEVHGFTQRYNGRTNVLRSDILISIPYYPPPGTKEPSPETLSLAKKYIGVWDTGATNCVISRKVVNECNLKPIGMTTVHTVGATRECETFLVSVFLPNRVVVPSVRATVGDLEGCDVLIGMDIISRGDFAITHGDGKTTFSFRLPSMETLDFGKGKIKQDPASANKIGRNQPCFCGSGKKYKKCHGM